MAVFSERRNDDISSIRVISLHLSKPFTVQRKNAAFPPAGAIRLVALAASGRRPGTIREPRVNQRATLGRRKIQPSRSVRPGRGERLF